MQIPVEVVGHRYVVQIEADFAGLGAAMSARWPPGRCVVVTNPVVAPLHAPALVAELAGAGWDPAVIEIPDGEAHKDLATWSSLVDRLLGAGLDRRTPILALGGGVTGDIVGFAAASTLRGLPLVQIPTTLLAMVDSSVGGKTGVNTAHGKNLVGAFYQPSLVWAPLHTLVTLPADELRCGLGEVVKHAVIAGEASMAELDASAAALCAREAGALAWAVASSVELKARIVAEDPLENGRRAVLNLGHTLGHALESTLGYGQLRHGEAVALGLLAVTRWAVRQGRTHDPGLDRRLSALLARLDLPTEAPIGLDRDRLVAAVGFDKKRARGKMRVVLPLAPGDVVLHDLAPEQVPSFVESLFPPAEDRC